MTSTLATTSAALAACHHLVPPLVPNRHLDAFHALTGRNQARVRLFGRLIEIIEAEPVRMMGYAKAAAFAAEQPETGKGCSESRIRIVYREFINNGRDWRALVDDALEASNQSGIPQAFIEHLQAHYVDKSTRGVKAGITRMLLEWTQGKKMPGYGTWRDWFTATSPALPMPADCPGYPKGWTERNLLRKLDSSTFRRTAQIQGRQAAAAHRPLVYSTRAGLYPGAVYQFDDLWHDFFVTSLSEKKAGRPLELFAHDLFSAYKVRWGIRIRTEGDNGKMQGLNQRMMRMLVAALLACDGYSPRGTAFNMERGTATLPDDLLNYINTASGGLITWHKGAMKGAAAHAGQYPGLKSGNPRFKASLESSNNLIHNRTGHLPGQTGPNRERRPESLHGLLKYNDQLLAAAALLPPHVAELLKFPLLTESQAVVVLAEIYKNIARETAHELEGWAAAGNITAEALVLGAWMNQEQLQARPVYEQQMVLEAMQRGEVETRQRNLSRGEVWTRGAGELVKMQGAPICHILGDEFAVERPVKSHLFEFRDRELGEGKHRYESKCIAPDGNAFYLDNGSTYLCTVNPFSEGSMFVRDAKGRFLGTCPRISSVMPGDIDSLQAAFERLGRTERDLLEPLRKRQQKEGIKRLALHKHNLDVVKDALGEPGRAGMKALNSLHAALKTSSDFGDSANNNNEPTSHNETESDW
jgi:hypothetical protein